MRRTLIFFVLLLPPFIAVAQEKSSTSGEQAPARRARIGVALEGGGALGLAHIGVLEWFEEHHIPVDYLAGTSMGGMVGGFYATGKSPAELKKLIEGVDWDRLLGDRTPYEDLSYRRKEDQRAYPNSLIFGLRNGLSLPAGLNAGHQISLLIDRETLPYFDVGSFDALPVPFRCVATDLVSGRQVVFDQGPLAEALRATMSIPGVFTPVTVGDKVLVDGGLVNNLPTDVVRQMGADIVIAVHLETHPAGAKDLQSIFSVLNQSVRVVVAESEVRGLERADAVVSVDLGAYGIADYKKKETIMQKGYEEANAKSRLLEKFTLSDAEWTEYMQERNARKRTAAPVPRFIQVKGTSGEQQASIERYLARFVDKPLDTESLDRALTRLTGVGKYDAIGYRFTEQNGKQGLLILVQEKTYAPPTIQPGFEMDGSESGDEKFTLGTRLTHLDVAGFRSEWRTDLSFGSTYGIASELYRPFTATSKWFFAPRADASDAAFHIYAKNDPVSDYRFYRADLGGDLGYGFGRFSEVRVGYEVGYLSTRLRLGTPEFPTLKGRIGAARFHYLMDRTDDPVIPRRGVRVESTFRWYNASPGAVESFPAMDLHVNYFQPISGAASLFVAGEGGTTFGTTNTGLPQFFLGGPEKLGAYGQNELNGDQYYLFRAGYLHDLFTLPPFVGKKIYAIGSFETGKMYGSLNESRFPVDGVAGIVAETALGPIFVGGSVGDTGHHKWFFQLGRVF
ncbi:MAG: patatin-like phospholipase family protein [Candidatus Acidiferrales bacterium]